MKKAYLFALSTLALFLSGAYGASAQGLVPCDEPYRVLGGVAFGCGPCQLLTLVQNIVNFTILLSIIVASLMFVYAGVLYMTSSANPTNISKGKDIFWKVLIGLFAVLAAWLVVNAVVITLTGSTLNQTTQEFCSAGDETQGSQAGLEMSAPGNLTGDASFAETYYGAPTGDFTSSVQGSFEERMPHNAAVEALNQEGIAVVASQGNIQANCQGVAGCTSLEGVRPPLVNYAIETNQLCPGGCGLVITAGTESAPHAGGEFSHGQGYKIDVRSRDPGTGASSAITEQVRGNPTRFQQLDNPLHGEAAYRDTQTGALWVLEGGSQPHWDVLLRP